MHNRSIYTSKDIGKKLWKKPNFLNTKTVFLTVLLHSVFGKLKGCTNGSIYLAFFSSFLNCLLVCIIKWHSELDGTSVWVRNTCISIKHKSAGQSVRNWRGFFIDWNQKGVAFYKQFVKKERKRWTKRGNNSYHRIYGSRESERDASGNHSSRNDCNKKEEWTENGSKSEARSEFCKQYCLTFMR